MRKPIGWVFCPTGYSSFRRAGRWRPTPRARGGLLRARPASLGLRALGRRLRGLGEDDEMWQVRFRIGNARPMARGMKRLRPSEQRPAVDAGLHDDQALQLGLEVVATRSRAPT